MTDPKQLLISGLEHDDPVVQADAARLLGEIACADAVPALLAYVSNSRHAYKTAGFEALMKIGDKSIIPDLEKLLAAPNVQDDWYWHMNKSVKAACAICLLSLGSKIALQHLVQLADDGQDIFYGWFAPSILRMDSGLPGVKQLQERLTVETIYKDGAGTLREMDPSFVITVSEALACMNTEDALEAQRSLCAWRSRYIRVQAARGLMQQSEAKEDKDLIQQMFNEAQTEFEESGLSAILFEQKLTDDISRVQTIAASSQDAFERAYAVEQLGIIADRSSLQVLEQATKDSDAYVRQNAVEALDRLDHSDASQIINTCAADESMRVRLQVAKAQSTREGATV